MKLQADKRVGAGGEVQGSCAGRGGSSRAPCRWFRARVCVLIIPAGAAGDGDGLTLELKEASKNHGAGRTGRGHRLRGLERAPQKPPRRERGPDTGRKRDGAPLREWREWRAGRRGVGMPCDSGRPQPGMWLLPEEAPLI